MEQTLLIIGIALAQVSDIQTCLRVSTTDWKDVKCPGGVDSRNMEWNNTIKGTTVFFPCSTFNADLSGNISRHCLENGTWMHPIYNCVRREITEIQTIVSNLTDMHSIDLVNVLQKLSTLTTQEQSDNMKHSSEIPVIIEVLKHVTTLDNISLTRNQTTSFLETVSNLLDPSYADTWQAVDIVDSVGEDLPKASSLLDIVSDFTDLMEHSLQGNVSSVRQDETIVTKNVLLQVRKINDSVGITFPEKGLHPEFSNMASLHLQKSSLEGSTTFSAVVYRKISDTVSTKENLHKFSSVLGSSIMSVKLNNWKNNDNFKITVSFQLFKKTKDLEATCSFLSDNSTIWDNEGCFLKSLNTTTAVCECNHLTNFAILMSPWTANNAESKPLRLITLAGCSISTFGLVITIVVHFHLWRYLKSDRVTLLMNLCVALVCFYAVFLGGVDRTENKDMCTTMAALIQFFSLVVFFFMLAEGIEIFFAVFYVFSTQSRLKWIIPSSWLVPALIVSISLAITRTKGYGNDQFCWLSVDNGLIWAFVGPALTILLINSVILGFVMWKIFKLKKMVRKKKLEKTMTGIRCLCILLPLFGITWILGIFYVNKSMSWVQYVFSVCNCAQGIVIFIFHCALNKQVRQAYERRQKRADDRLDMSKQSSRHNVIPRGTIHSASSAMYSVSSASFNETSFSRDGEIQSKDIGIHNQVQMKRFQHINTDPIEGNAKM